MGDVDADLVAISPSDRIRRLEAYGVESGRKDGRRDRRTSFSIPQA